MARVTPQQRSRLDTGEQVVGRPVPPSGGRVPRRADGVELLGRYEGSGFKEPPFLVRRADGQVIQLPHPLYAIVEAVDGSATYEEIADRASESIGAGLDPDDVRMLVDKKLRSIGVLAAPDGSSPSFKKVDPLLGLRFKRGVIPARLVRALTASFKPFFNPAVVIVVLAGIVAMDVWVFGAHGVAQAIRQTIYAPALLGLLFAMIVVAAALHEIGHATACAYGGAKPGEMGVGLYVVWPAFYTDVTDAYRLGRGGRLRTDLGGIYFNGLFTLAVFGVYLATRFEFLLLVILVQHFAVLQQLLPFLRLDGYYVIADLTGVPDMFSRIRPILAGMIPWRETDERVRELKPWARAVVTAWVLLLVPVMLFILGTVVMHLPRIVGTAADSWGRQWEESRAAFARGNVLAGVGSLGEMVVLSLPAAAGLLTTTRVGKRIIGGGWRGTSEKPIARALFLAALAAFVGLAGYILLPDEDYRPIQPGERWTAGESAVSFTKVLEGAPGLVPAERALQEDRSAAGGSTSAENAGPVPADVATQDRASQPAPSPTPTPSSTPTASATPSPQPSESSSPGPSGSPSASPAPSPSGQL